jgi:hypothetical protein
VICHFLFLGSPSTFDFCDDRPEATLDPEWRALIRQQARTLTAMLQHIQTAVAGVHRHTDAIELQTVAADAERLLAAQAHQHVSLERELGQLRALVTELSPAPVAMTQRVQRLERVLAVLHANLTVARRTIATLTHAQA